MEKQRNDVAPEKLAEEVTFLADVSQWIKTDSNIVELAKKTKKDNMLQAIKDNMPNFVLKKDTDAYVESTYESMKELLAFKKDAKSTTTTAPKNDALGNLIDGIVPGATSKLDEMDPSEVARNDKIAKMTV